MVLLMARPFKHPKTGIYWFRKRVPNTLCEHVGTPHASGMRWAGSDFQLFSGDNFTAARDVLSGCRYARGAFFLAFANK
ncbi:hypothetical protein [Mesorhizobium sp. A623]